MLALGPLFLTLIGMIPVAGPMLAIAVGAIGSALGRILSNKYALMAIAAFIALGAADIHGRRAERAKCETRIEKLHSDASAAAKERDQQIAAELEQKYGPVVRAMKSHSEELQQQVDQYEQQLFLHKIPKCELGDEPSQLRKRK